MAGKMGFYRRSGTSRYAHRTHCPLLPPSSHVPFIICAPVAIVAQRAPPRAHPRHPRAFQLKFSQAPLRRLPALASRRRATGPTTRSRPLALHRPARSLDLDPVPPQRVYRRSPLSSPRGDLFVRRIWDGEREAEARQRSGRTSPTRSSSTSLARSGLSPSA